MKLLIGLIASGYFFNEYFKYQRDTGETSIIAFARAIIEKMIGVKKP